MNVSLTKPMIKSILAIAALALACVAVSASTTTASNGTAFSSPAAQVSWQNNANMTSHTASEVAAASAKSILGVQSYGFGQPTGTYNCSYDCTRSCTNTCSTNYRCR